MSENRFGDALRTERITRGLSQKQLAEALTVAAGSISNWETGRELPNLEYVLKLGEIWSKATVYKMLFGMMQTQYKGIGWIEEIPDYLGERQREEVELGVGFFKELVCENRDLHDLNSIYPYSLWNLQERYSHFKAAIQTGSLRLTEVARNKDLEARLIQAYPSILDEYHTVVVNVENDNDGTPIRAEFVAFAAMQEIFMKRRPTYSVAVGAGYTVWRVAQQSILGGNLTGTEWIPLMAFRQDQNTPYSANHIAGLLANLHQKSTALYLTYKEDQTIERNEAGKKVHYALKSCENAIITVNGAGPRYRKAIPNSLSEFRGDDYSSFNEIQEVYNALPDELKRKVAGEILGFLLDDDGNPVENEQSRAIRLESYSQVPLDRLKDIPIRGRVWVVAAMRFKARAVKMALKAGYANALVIDSTIAQWLIENPI